jgi:hypothetical protein
MLLKGYEKLNFNLKSIVLNIIQSVMKELTASKKLCVVFNYIALALI